jgi:hypothetical protein
MKKTVILLLALGLLAGLGNAQAEAAYAHDAVPQAVQAMVAQENADATASDCILFTDVPTGPVCLLLTDWGMNGYQLQDGVWTRYAQVSPIQQEANARQHLIRHNAGSAPGLQGACGLTYPDGLGFDLLKVDINFPSHVLVRLQYHAYFEQFSRKAPPALNERKANNLLFEIPVLAEAGAFAPALCMPTLNSFPQSSPCLK